MQPISLAAMVTAAATDAERQMMTNVAARTGLSAETVASLLINDGDLVALFETVLSMLFREVDQMSAEVDGDRIAAGCTRVGGMHAGQGVGQVGGERSGSRSS